MAGILFSRGDVAINGKALVDILLMFCEDRFLIEIIEQENLPDQEM
jgi:hypothetical protein